MKIFAPLLAIVSATTSEWLINQWWEEAQSVYNIAKTNYPAFKGAVDAVSDDLFKPSFKYCGGKNGHITSSDLMVCGAKVAEFSGISEGSQSYMYDFGAKYYSLVDPENTGVLTFKKYKMVYAALAATNAKVIMTTCDQDKNGVLSGGEIKKWYALGVEQANNWNYKVTDAQWAGIKQAYKRANSNHDNVATLFELAKFEVMAGNVFIE